MYDDIQVASLILVVPGQLPHKRFITISKYIPNYVSDNIFGEIILEAAKDLVIEVKEEWEKENEI